MCIYSVQVLWACGGLALREFVRSSPQSCRWKPVGDWTKQFIAGTRRCGPICLKCTLKFELKWGFHSFHSNWGESHTLDVKNVCLSSFLTWFFAAMLLEIYLQTFKRSWGGTVVPVVATKSFPFRGSINAFDPNPSRHCLRSWWTSRAVIRWAGCPDQQLVSISKCCVSMCFHGALFWQWQVHQEIPGESQ